MSLHIILRALKNVNISSNIVKNTKTLPLCGCYQQKLYSLKPTRNIVKEIDPETGKVKKKKTSVIPKITLLNGNQISITTKEEAEKLAKRRDLKLVKIVDLDTKTERPVYKLMTGAEYHAEDLIQREKRKNEKQNSTIKGEKVLIVGQNISEHDLETNIKKITKWLEKHYEVRMVINGDSNNMSKAEKNYSLLETKLKDIGRFLQKRQKGSDIKFQILPPKNDKKSDKNDNEL